VASKSENKWPWTAPTVCRMARGFGFARPVKWSGKPHLMQPPLQRVGAEDGVADAEAVVLKVRAARAVKVKACRVGSAGQADRTSAIPMAAAGPTASLKAPMAADISLRATLAGVGVAALIKGTR